MPGTPTLAHLGESLLTTCRRRADGSLQYDSDRPRPGLASARLPHPRLILPIRGAAQVATLQKRRWLDPRTGRTVHSRPPGELGARRFCALIVFVELYDWLDGPAG